MLLVHFLLGPLVVAASPAPAAASLPARTGIWPFRRKRLTPHKQPYHFPSCPAYLPDKHKI